MANKGTINGKTVLSNSAWESFHDKPTMGNLFGEVGGYNFTQGGIVKFEEENNSGRSGFFGWQGYGGSVFQWHPELQIGFGYVPTLLEWYSADNNKARLLQAEVVSCLNRKHSKV